MTASETARSTVVVVVSGATVVVVSASVVVVVTGAVVAEGASVTVVAVPVAPPQATMTRARIGKMNRGFGAVTGFLSALVVWEPRAEPRAPGIALGIRGLLESCVIWCSHSMNPPAKRATRLMAVVEEGAGMDMERSVPTEPPIPLGQVIFDEMFLWFFLSIVTSLVFYNIWGLLDLLRVPLAGS